MFGRNVGVGPDLEGSGENLAECVELAAPRARFQDRVEARGLASRCPAITTVPPRFGVCARAPPAPETARSEATIAAATAAARATMCPRSSGGCGRARSCGPWVQNADGSGIWKRGRAGTSRAICAVGPVQDACLLARVEDPVSLVEVARHQPLAVTRVVHQPSAAEDLVEPGRAGIARPCEERDVEVPPAEGSDRGTPEAERRSARPRSPTCLSCAWASEIRLRPGRDTRTRHEAKRESLSAADVDAVGACAAAGLPEQPPGFGGATAVSAPVPPVVGARFHEHDAVVHRGSSGTLLSTCRTSAVRSIP